MSNRLIFWLLVVALWFTATGIVWNRMDLQRKVNSLELRLEDLEERQANTDLQILLLRKGR